MLVHQLLPLVLSMRFCSLTDVKPKIEQQAKMVVILKSLFRIIGGWTKRFSFLFEAMLVSLQTIERDYGKYMKIINS